MQQCSLSHASESRLGVDVRIKMRIGVTPSNRVSEITSGV